ncbi:phage portal protein [Propionibacteriaceae bacterium Y1923]
MTELLQRMLAKLDEPQARYTSLEAYYHGTQPMAYLSPDARTAIGNRFGRMATNLPRLAVTALAERLRITGLTGGPQLWADWIANDLDQLAGVAHREALTLGSCPVIVWADAQGNPQVSVESATQVAVLRDPATREVVAAVKRWEDGRATHANLFEADVVTKFTSNTPGATTTGFTVAEVLANPFGVVPVVELRNSDRLLGPGASELDDLVPLVDALNKSLADLMVTSEFYARPRRWAVGVEPAEVIDEATGDVSVVNPFPDSDRMMISESPETKFGQLPGADLGAYEASVRVLLGQVMAVSALPAHYVGVLADQPASADALRAAEASLTARAESRQQMFGRAWEKVAALMVATRTGADPRATTTTIKWADAATRSVAQEADAVVKLVQANILPRSHALRKLGYTDEQITAITAELTTNSTSNTN